MRGNVSPAFFMSIVWLIYLCIVYCIVWAHYCAFFFYFINAVSFYIFSFIHFVLIVNMTSSLDFGGVVTVVVG